MYLHRRPRAAVPSQECLVERARTLTNYCSASSFWQVGQSGSVSQFSTGNAGIYRIFIWCSLFPSKRPTWYMRIIVRQFCRVSGPGVAPQAINKQTFLLAQMFLVRNRLAKQCTCYTFLRDTILVPLLCLVQLITRRLTHYINRIKRGISSHFACNFASGLDWACHEFRRRGRLGGRFTRLGGRHLRSRAAGAQSIWKFMTLCGSYCIVSVCVVNVSLRSLKRSNHRFNLRCNGFYVVTNML